MAEPKNEHSTATDGIVRHERERQSGRLEPETGPVAGAPEQAPGSLRYVGGGPEGGQNFSNEGYGANQSYSAGNGYAAAPSSSEAGKKPQAEDDQAAVSPEDLGVRDYDLQGGYGKPPQRPK